MEFFLDTASIEEIKKWEQYGIVNGVTTNPTLLSKEKKEPIEQIKKIASMVNGPVSVEVTNTIHEKMILQGKKLSRIADNIIIKVPATNEGFLAAKEFTRDEIKCNITLTFDPAQAIPFCLLPVNYISLIVGRTEDFGIDDIKRIQQLRGIIKNMNSKSKILAASIRNSHHLIESILGEADSITVPPNTWNNIFQNPLTLSGERDFINAWKELPEEIRKKYEEIL